MTYVACLTPRLRSKYGEHAFSYAGPAAWNRLPETIRQAQTQAPSRSFEKHSYSRNLQLSLNYVMSVVRFVSASADTKTMMMMMMMMIVRYRSRDRSYGSSACKLRSSSSTGQLLSVPDHHHINHHLDDDERFMDRPSTAAAVRHKSGSVGDLLNDLTTTASRPPSDLDYLGRCRDDNGENHRYLTGPASATEKYRSDSVGDLLDDVEGKGGLGFKKNPGS